MWRERISNALISVAGAGLVLGLIYAFVPGLPERFPLFAILIILADALWELFVRPGIGYLYHLFGRMARRPWRRPPRED